jgi:RNA polymerase sigma-70 factor (ECF subfamily)
MLLKTSLRPASVERPEPVTLEQLYRDHFDFVYRIARRLGGDALHPEEIAQDVFLVVSRKLATYQPAVQVTTWLYGITLNVVRSRRRRARLEALYRTNEEAGHVVALRSVDSAEVAAAWRIASSILVRLSPKKRDVFVLGELEGLSCAEIAAIVGTNEATVWSRLHYARKEFETHLQTLYPELVRGER